MTRRARWLVVVGILLAAGAAALVWRTATHGDLYEGSVLTPDATP